MKRSKLFLVIILILMLTGCKVSNRANQGDEASPSPDITRTVNPSALQTPEALPTAVTSITNQPSKIPTPSSTPTPSALPVSPTKAAEITEKPNNTAIVQKMLEAMNLEEKVGQLFFVRCNKDTAKKDIAVYHLGGLILFSEDFMGSSKEEVKQAINSYQKASDIPLLIGVDEEGGTVNRVSKYREFRTTPFLSPQELYKEGGFATIIKDTIEKAKLLKSLGIQVNLAPVCDVSTDPKDFIYKRSFGENAKGTSKYVKAVVQTMKSQGIGSTLKHFPGYGNNVDTHTGIAVDKRNKQSFIKSDFLPFQAGIEAGADSILVSHNIVNSFDKNLPASLSPAIHNILRKDFGYDGILMTDDLSMNAITSYTGNENAAVLAVIAGNDMIISSDYMEQIKAVVTAVKEKKISEDQINTSVKRILIWKLNLNML